MFSGLLFTFPLFFDTMEPENAKKRSVLCKSVTQKWRTDYVWNCRIYRN